MTEELNRRVTDSGLVTRREIDMIVRGAISEATRAFEAHLAVHEAEDRDQEARTAAHRHEHSLLAEVVRERRAAHEREHELLQHTSNLSIEAHAREHGLHDEAHKREHEQTALALEKAEKQTSQALDKAAQTVETRFGIVGKEHDTLRESVVVASAKGEGRQLGSAGTIAAIVLVITTVGTLLGILVIAANLATN